MSFTPEPGTPLATYWAETQPGSEPSSCAVRRCSTVTIGRYAMTIGATDLIHHDPAAARSAGYADVVAPPNLLAVIVEWGIEPRSRPPGRRNSQRL